MRTGEVQAVFPGKSLGTAIPHGPTCHFLDAEDWIITCGCPANLKAELLATKAMTLSLTGQPG